MTFEQLNKEQQLSIEAEQEFQAEASVVSKEYHDIMELYENVDKRNRAIIAGDMETYHNLTDEMFGDI